MFKKRFCFKVVTIDFNPPSMTVPVAYDAIASHDDSRRHVTLASRDDSRCHMTRSSYFRPRHVKVFRAASGPIRASHSMDS